MKDTRITIQLLFFLSLLISAYIYTPVVLAEEHNGQAVFKDIMIENDGKNVTLQEPMILFEGQRYLPLRAVTHSLQKSIYMDESTNNIVIENTPPEELPLQEEDQPSSNRPSIQISEKVTSDGVILLEDNETNIMFQKNGFSKYYPASTTKVLTALVALERGNLEDKVIVSKNVNTLPGDSRRVFIQPGDELTLEQLLYGMLLHSGNDAALAIAEHIAGSEEAFSKLMNDKAEEVGATASHFVNPHGYHHPDHYTTPYDLALILKAASEKPKFLEIIHTPSYKATYKNRNGKSIVKNWQTTVSFLKNSDLFIEGMIGGKTGYTNAAKRNLVTVADYNGHRYFVVALKGNSVGRYIDTRKLLNSAYQKREEFDRENIKNIKIHFFDHAVKIANQFISSPRQIFIYKGRTYVSQSFLNEILADVQYKSIEDNLVKVDIEPKFAFEKSAIPLANQILQQHNQINIENTFAVTQSVHVLALSSSLTTPIPMAMGMNILGMASPLGYHRKM